MAIKTGDVFSESSKYIVKSVENGIINLVHQESGSEVQVTENDIKTRMISADYFSTTKEVSKKDRKSGESGIRSIFESIPENAVFTVTYKKKDTPKTKKALTAEKETRVLEVIKTVQKAHDQKKSMSKKCIDEVKKIINNPILDVVPGETRVLRGYKLKKDSGDGYYLCQDMDIQKSSKDSGERLVNINTISELIYNGTKYTVK